MYTTKTVGVYCCFMRNGYLQRNSVGRYLCSGPGGSKGVDEEGFGGGGELLGLVAVLPLVHLRVTLDGLLQLDQRGGLVDDLHQFSAEGLEGEVPEQIRSANISQRHLISKGLQVLRVRPRIATNCMNKNGRKMYLVAEVVTIVAVLQEVAFMGLDPVSQLLGLEPLEGLLTDLRQAPDDRSLESGKQRCGRTVEGADQSLFVLVVAHQAEVLGQVVLDRVCLRDHHLLL